MPNEHYKGLYISPTIYHERQAARMVPLQDKDGQDQEIWESSYGEKSMERLKQSPQCYQTN